MHQRKRKTGQSCNLECVPESVGNVHLGTSSGAPEPFVEMAVWDSRRALTILTTEFEVPRIFWSNLLELEVECSAFLTPLTKSSNIVSTKTGIRIIIQGNNEAAISNPSLFNMSMAVELPWLLASATCPLSRHPCGQLHLGWRFCGFVFVRSRRRTGGSINSSELREDRRVRIP